MLIGHEQQKKRMEKHILLPQIQQEKNKHFGRFLFSYVEPYKPSNEQYPKQQLVLKTISEANLMTKQG